jgi:hypothetical protein
MLDRNPQRKALLREGLTSYLDAVMAVDEFTRMIQEDCRAVLERQMSPLQKATGLTFSLKGIADYSEPYKSRPKLWAGQYAWIGTEVPVVRSADIYSVDVGLAWNYENGTTSTNVYSCFYTKQLGVLNELDSKMRKRSNAEFEIDKTHYGLILWGENATGPDGEYDLEPLERVVVEWISIWKKAGGVAKMLLNGGSKK